MVNPYVKTFWVFLLDVTPVSYDSPLISGMANRQTNHQLFAPCMSYREIITENPILLFCCSDCPEFWIIQYVALATDLSHSLLFPVILSVTSIGYFFCRRY